MAAKKPTRKKPHRKVKAEGDPEQPALDDDPRWLPIEVAHQRRVEQTGDPVLANIDLMGVLMKDRLRCMARSTGTGARALIAATRWADQIELYWSDRDGPLVVYRRQPEKPHRHIVVKPVRGCRFYIWQPDYEAIWPAPAVNNKQAPEPPAAAPLPAPRHAGGAEPEHNWEGAALYIDALVVKDGLLPRRRNGKPYRVRAVELIEGWLKKNEPPPLPKQKSIFRWLRQNPCRHVAWWGDRLDPN